MTNQKDIDSVSQLFVRCFESFEESCRKSSAGQARCYHLGPLDLEVHLAHPGMEVFVKALSHLRGPLRHPDPLKIYFWDGVESRGSKPPLPDLKRSSGTPVELFCHRGPDTKFTYLFWNGNLSFEAFSATANKALFWTTDHRKPAYPDCGAPLFNLIARFLRSRGLMVVHAGAVGLNGRGVLIAGTGGSGKTTTCLNSLASGMDYLGEDHTILGGTSHFRAYSLYCSAKIKPGPARHQIEFSENDRMHFDHWQDEKELVYLYPGFRSRLASALEIDAVVFPQISDSPEPALRKISAPEALRRLAPSTVLQMQNPEAKDLAQLGNLVRKVPAWVLETGSDSAKMCRLLRGLIEKGSA